MVSISIFAVMLLVIIISFFFALSGGLHGASAIIATIIMSGAASPKGAVLLTSVFGLAGAVFGGSLVASTVSSIIELPVSPALLPILLSAVMGAVLWNVLTMRVGLPSSTTHALVGGILGAVIISSGAGHVNWGVHALTGPAHQLQGMVKIVLALILSPAFGFGAAFLFGKLSALLLKNAKVTVNRWIKRAQWVVVASLSFSYGTNDTQKILGIVVLALAAGGNTALHNAPVWSRLCLGVIMFLGTLLGGWNVMKTLGRGLFTLRPIDSLNSQLASAGWILAANLTGAPVSSTHVVVGGIMGVGSAANYKMVNWNIVREILISWVITIPMAGIAAALIYSIFDKAFIMV